MKNISHHIENARESLKANRLRTFLTITGVAIGVASIVAILSLSDGAKKLVTKQVDSVGGNIAVIRSGSPSKQESTADIINSQTQGSYTTLTEADLQKVAAIENIKSTVPVSFGYFKVKGDGKEQQGTVVGTSADFLTVNKIELQSGEFVARDNSPVVIGAQLSVDLFGTEESLGKTIVIKNQKHYVGGIIKRQSSPLNINGVDLNSAAILTSGQLKSLNPAAPLQQITVEADSVSSLDKVVIDINKTLLTQHGGEQDFRVLSGGDIAEPQSQLFSVIAGVTTAVAAISLFVGGIGIMNIMLVNVAERTREIGIRKALGATRGDIMGQFMIESIIMALTGGVVGVILGLGVAFSFSLFLVFEISFSLGMLLAAMITAGLVGVVFGLYPALRAAGNSPIAALNKHN